MDCHSPALDSGFRRNDASRQAISWFVMPTKVGAFRYPGLFGFFPCNHADLIAFSCKRLDWPRRIPSSAPSKEKLEKADTEGRDKS